MAQTPSPRFSCSPHAGNSSALLPLTTSTSLAIAEKQEVAHMNSDFSGGVAFFTKDKQTSFSRCAPSRSAFSLVSEAWLLFMSSGVELGSVRQAFWAFFRLSPPFPFLFFFLLLSFFS